MPKRPTTARRADGVEFGLDHQVVTAIAGWCAELECGVPRGIVGSVTRIHENGEMTVTVRYRGKRVKWRTGPDRWLTTEEWKKSYPDEYRQWRAHTKDPDAALRVARG